MVNIVKHFFLMGILLFTLSGIARAEDLQPAQSELDAGYQDLYNLQFDDAHKSFGDWEQKHPDDPLGPASNAAAYLFSEFNRLHVLEMEFFADDKNFQNQHQLAPDSAVKQQFDAEIAKAEQLSDQKLKQNPKDTNAMFAKVLALGLRGDYLALIEKQNSGGLSNIKKARSLAEELLKIDPSCYDAYVALGTENYLLSQKSMAIRLFLWLGGAQSNKTKGLNDLRLAADKGHYFAPYARLLLAVAATRDHDSATARALLGNLAQSYPKNDLYAKELAKLP